MATTATKKAATTTSRNYNEKQEAFLLENYRAGMNTEELAPLVKGVNELAEKGEPAKTVHSVRSKLSNMKDSEGEPLYVPAQKAAVGGASSERKLTIVREIEAIIGLGKDELLSLEKSNKGHLDALREHVQMQASKIDELQALLDHANGEK
jgi:hypothetical protein